MPRNDFVSKVIETCRLQRPANNELELSIGGDAVTEIGKYIDINTYIIISPPTPTPVYTLQYIHFHGYQ